MSLIYLAYYSKIQFNETGVYLKYKNLDNNEIKVTQLFKISQKKNNRNNILRYLLKYQDAIFLGRVDENNFLGIGGKIF